MKKENIFIAIVLYAVFLICCFFFGIYMGNKANAQETTMTASVVENPCNKCMSICNQ
jgi:hypothetical protein